MKLPPVHLSWRLVLPAFWLIDHFDKTATCAFVLATSLASLWLHCQQLSLWLCCKLVRFITSLCACGCVALHWAAHY